MRIISISMALLLGSGLAQAGNEGEQLFQQNCMACHQTQGQGIPGAFPALADNPLVQGNREQLLKVVLHGRGGMPAFAQSLPDHKIAAILSYVRSHWGNEAGAIAELEVAAIRQNSTKSEVVDRMQVRTQN
ncbi:c-type cytochrome [Zobellella sp. DQSA1]|uniref:c-type cytochrome n=1 Tax=Zobellella sp. DQSA1 TaxID=3342386 RepID=UPI0035BF0566